MSVAKCFTDFHIDMGTRSPCPSTEHCYPSVFLARWIVGVVPRAQRTESLLATSAHGVSPSTVRRMAARWPTERMLLRRLVHTGRLSDGHSRAGLDVLSPVRLDSRRLHARRFARLRRQLSHLVQDTHANQSLDDRAQSSGRSPTRFTPSRLFVARYPIDFGTRTSSKACGSPSSGTCMGSRASHTSPTTTTTIGKDHEFG